MQLVIAELELVFGRFLRKVPPRLLPQAKHGSVEDFQSWLARVSVIVRVTIPGAYILAANQTAIKLACCGCTARI